MAHIRPFPALRPRDDLAGEIISPPYDVLSEAEARAIAAPNPRSFLHVTRPDADLPSGADAHGPEAYQAARTALDRFRAEGWLQADDQPCFYLYSQTWQGRTQVGLMAACSVEEYDRDLIKKHELTRPDKEQDRVDHIEALDAQTGLVFLAYRDRFDAVRQALREAASTPMSWSVQTDDGVRHVLQVISEPQRVAAIRDAFAQVPALYVADGHHRSAAASRVAASRDNRGASGWFLAGIFPDTQLEVLAYNRVVHDLAGLTVPAFLDALAASFTVGPAPDPLPAGRGRITMYLDGAWRELVPRPEVVPDDPVGRLDVAVLQDRVLAPLLGIDNPRTDSRITFVGGIRGPQALVAAVHAASEEGRAAVAFHMFPTGMDQLFAVADAGRLMPPKSTWFEPKLRGGVVIHRI